MSLHLLTKCPKCGLSLTFPAMPSIDYVIEGLMAESGGKCPECGEQVVVGQPPPKPVRSDALALASSVDEVRAVPVVDLPLSIRCRLAISRLGVSTVGELLDLKKQTVRERLREDPAFMDGVEQLLGKHNINW